MNAATGKHPPREVLQAFGLGKLDEASSTQVGQHLETCSDCKRQVADLSSDSLLDKLRQANGPVNTPAPGRTLSPLSAAQQPSSSPPGIPPELQNNSQFEIVRELGAGGMGVVYLAKNKLMDRLEVLKVISTSVVHKAGALDRFLREIRAAAKLSHDNIVKAYSALQFGELLVFAMEYVEGEDLAKIVKTQGALPIANACYYARQVALGLQHACESQMVHRDIKPHNLILARVGKKHTVKILDFGLAKATSEKKFDRDLTGEGKMLGTPDYMAPEQSMDAASADIRADIYSLGCTLYYLMTGKPPFNADSLLGLLMAHQNQDAKSLSLVRPEVSGELAAIVAKMMAKDPAKRFQKPAEVVQALTPFLTKPEAKAPPAVSLGAQAKPETQGHEGPVRRSETIAAAQKVTDLFAFNIEPAAPSTTPKPTKATTKVATRFKPVVLASAAGAVVLVGLLLWAVGVFRVKTSEGVLVVEVNEPNPDVYVDGAKIKVTWGKGGKHAEIRTKPGTRNVEVRKRGFRVSGEKVTVEEGERTIFTARLEKAASITSKALNVQPEPSSAAKPASVADVAPAKAGGFTNSLGIEFVLVPRGKSWLGGEGGSLGAQEVDIAYNFFLGKYEVTQEEWQKVTGNNPSEFQAVAGIDKEDQKRFPVERVSWDDCQMFIKQLNEQAKEAGWIYRLPREVEWEYACRGGPMTDRTQSGFNFYFEKPTNKLRADQANYQYPKALKRTCKVGSYDPNRLGLYDMHGNVFEWCDGVFDPKDPAGASSRANRGGSYLRKAGNCRTASRTPYNASTRYSDIGLRLARVPVGAEVVKIIAPKEKEPTVETKTLPIDGAWQNSVATMSAADQVKAVAQKLRELNAGFDGNIGPKIKKGVVVELRFPTDAVIDISPVRVLPSLQRLNLGTPGNKGKLADLTPLKGMKLTFLNLGGCCQVKNLTPLEGIPLYHLDLAYCREVADLTPLKGMPLTWLGLFGSSRISDLTPLRGMRLTFLDAGGCRTVKDLTPLQGMPLNHLNLQGFNQVRDLTPLKGMPLTLLGFWGVKELGDLTPLKGMPLRRLWLANSPAKDLTPLDGMQLEVISISPKRITQGIEVLRRMKSLNTIKVGPNDYAAAEFWKRYDAGEFKNAGSDPEPPPVGEETELGKTEIKELPLASKAPPSTPAKLPQIENSIGMKLALIPAGTFLMGSPADDPERFEDEGPQHEVEITRPFYMGIHEVTVGQFKTFVKGTGYKTDVEKAGGGLRFIERKWVRDPNCNWANPYWVKPGEHLADDQPASYMSWNDAQAFCAWLSKNEGRRYSLPTEAQWEYACRAGSTTKFPCQDSELGEFAWYPGNSGGMPHPVGLKKRQALRD